MTDRDIGSISNWESIRSFLTSCSSIQHFGCRENRSWHCRILINKKKKDSGTAILYVVFLNFVLRIFPRLERPKITEQ
jgi:hypothetical protein